MGQNGVISLRAKASDMLVTVVDDGGNETERMRGETDRVTLFVYLSVLVSAVEMTPSVQWAAVVSDRWLDKRMGVENIAVFSSLIW